MPKYPENPRVTLGGNSTSAGAGYQLIQNGTMTLAGGNAVTLSQDGNAVTISAASQSVQAETQTFVGGIQNSQTTYTSGTVNLSVVAGNLTIRSTTGQAFQFSMSQTVQPETQTAISGIANSQTTYTSGTVSLSELGAITIRSTTGNQYQFSVNAQSVQPETQTFIAGIQNSQTTYTSGTVNLSVVAGNLTIRSTTGNAFQFSASQSVQAETQTAISGIANSQTTYTSGTVSLSELGAITIRSTTGNQYQFSVNSQTVQTQNMVAVSATNTLYSSGTVLFTGSNMITVKSSAAGQTIILDATQSVQTQGVLSIGASTGGNTAGNTTVNTGSRLVFVGSNNITVSQGTAAGATTLTLSGPSAQTGISAISNSNTTYTSGTIGLSELGAITIRSTTGNQFQFSVNSQTVQTQSNIQAFYDGANSVTTGTVRLTDANGVTFSLNAQTLSASVNQSISMFAVSNTTQSSSGTAHKSALSFAGAGGASVGVTGGTVVVSVPTGGGAFSGGMSTNGNTSGDTGFATQRLALIGGNNITLSGSTNGGSMSITVSAPNLGAGAMSAGVSTGGNTAGATGITGTQLVLVGSNNITLSQTTGANGGTVSINAPASSSLSAVAPLSISTNGSTISLLAPATSSMSATGQVSISTNGSTISIGVPNPLVSYRWIEDRLLMGATQGVGNSGATNTTVTAWVMPMTLANDLAFNNILLAAHNSFSSNTTSISSVNYSYSMGASVGFYTLTGSTMSRVTSFSNSLAYSNATAANVTGMSLGATVGYGGSSTTKSTGGGANMSAIMSSINSVRQIPLNWTTLGNTLTRGQYWAVVAFSQLTAGAAQASLSQVGFVSNFSIIGSAINPPELMQNTASMTSPYPFLGQATLVNSSNELMPSSFATSKITTATAIANSTKFQSIWMRIFSSHSN